MANIGSSALGFTRGLGGAVFSAFAAITNPLAIAKMMGLVDPKTQWVLGDTFMQLLFLAIAVGWAFAWYHGIQKRLERGAREPDMPLYRVCRWIAKDSVWASNYQGSDDHWVRRVEAELFTKWQLGRFEMMGLESTGNGGVNYLPPAIKGTATFDTHKLVMAEPPHHIWSEDKKGSDGMPVCFYDVCLDTREVKEVWPRRSILSRLRRKSPVERLGGPDYGGIFKKQDECYSAGITIPETPLHWMIGGR